MSGSAILLEVSDWMGRREWAKVVIPIPDQNRNQSHYLILTWILNQQRQGWRETTTLSAS